jgi:hypothetical protein
MERPAKSSLGIALWVGVTVVACSCMPQTEPPPGPEAVPASSSGDTLTIHVLGPDDTPIEGAIVDMWENSFSLEDDEGFQRERRTGQELSKGEYRVEG